MSLLCWMKIIMVITTNESCLSNFDKTIPNRMLSHKQFEEKTKHNNSYRGRTIDLTHSLPTPWSVSKISWTSHSARWPNRTAPPLQWGESHVCRWATSEGWSGTAVGTPRSCSPRTFEYSGSGWSPPLHRNLNSVRAENIV
jgi:hypothetical protein